MREFENTAIKSIGDHPRRPHLPRPATPAIFRDAVATVDVAVDHRGGGHLAGIAPARQVELRCQHLERALQPPLQTRFPPCYETIPESLPVAPERIPVLAIGRQSPPATT